MGPLGSPFSKVGVEITDSPYVVANMRIMTRMGKAALEQLGDGDDFVPGLHSLGDLSPDRRFIVPLPRGAADLERRLRLRRQRAARQEVLRAAHRQHHGARPGLDGRAHADPRLEMPGGRDALHRGRLPVAPAARPTSPCWSRPLEQQGWKVWTVGDDIAWLRPGPDGRLWAINPEAGFFGVAPGHQPRRPTRTRWPRSRTNTIFTNVAVTDGRRARGGRAWTSAGPSSLIDWQGKPWDAARGEGRAPELALHRAGAPVPVASRRSWEDPQGVPISAIIFGGRRARVGAARVPGVRLGARRVRRRDRWRSETTAAADRRGRRRAPRPDGHAAVLRLQHGRLLRATGCAWAGALDAARRRSSTSTGSARTTTASSSGPASARTCACCSGSSTASRARAARGGDAGRAWCPRPRR